MNNIEENPRRMMRLPEVKHLTGLSKSTIYEQIARKEFPQAVEIGPMSVAWRCGDIYEWIDSRPTCQRTVA